MVFRRRDLPFLREFVKRRALNEGLPENRALDLVIAVNEVATNTVVHAKAPGFSGSGEKARHCCARSAAPGGSATRSPGGPAARPGQVAARAWPWSANCVAWPNCDPGRGAPPSGCT
jgi:hypothetical protein